MRYPKSLGTWGRKFWKEVLTRWDFSGEELLVLEGTANALDSFHRAREILANQGTLYETSRGVKMRPEVAIMKDSWRSFLAGVKTLRLDLPEEKQKTVGRPTGSKVEKLWQSARMRSAAN